MIFLSCSPLHQHPNPSPLIGLKCFPKDGSLDFSSPHPAASPPSPPPWSSLGLPNWRKLHNWWFVYLATNQQINGLTFINQNTVQITPIKIIVWIAKLQIYFVYLYTALFTAGLFITGGSGEHKTSIEMFPATLCPVTPFPIPSFPTSLTGKGRYSHSLSVVDNGRKLVSCGGRHADGYSYSSLLLDRFIQKHCISWRSGQDKWTYERNLM